MTNQKTFHIFIGYDERQPLPFAVAKYTLEKHATIPIKVHKLDHRELRDLGLFNRVWTVDAKGQYIDNLDGKPFSTQFSFTRFLVPALWKKLTTLDKHPWVMFVDCDFVFTGDIKKLFLEIQDHYKTFGTEQRAPVWCVKHDYKPAESTKMDGMQQVQYNMKLWSSLMVFDMWHTDCDNLTPDYVNTASGRDLHTFEWVSDVESIGSLDESWNFIPDHSEGKTAVTNGLHYTEGGPWFKEYRDCRYNFLWNGELVEYYKSLLDFDLNALRGD